MKIWKCQCYDTDMGVTLSWHNSKRDAEKHLHEFQRNRRAAARHNGDDGDAVGPEGVSLEIIPEKKDGLLTWLNINFTADNG